MTVRSILLQTPSIARRSAGASRLKSRPKSARRAATCVVTQSSWDSEGAAAAGVGGALLHRCSPMASSRAVAGASAAPACNASPPASSIHSMLAVILLRTSDFLLRARAPALGGHLVDLVDAVVDDDVGEGLADF